MADKLGKIRVKGLYTVFGNNSNRALELAEEGKNKDTIMQETGQVVALRDINFQVQEGEIFVIMGLSGSGKSTLLRCINRLREPTRGHIYYEDTEITGLSAEELRYLRRHTLGMVFQRFALFPHRTVLENTVFGLEIQGVAKEQRVKQGEEVLERVGLSGWGAKKTGTLSGGMQQRVGLARALAIDPEVLLMDEPFSALDPMIRTNLQEELLKLQSRLNKTILFVTHDLNEAIKVGDRIGILDGEGKMVQLGTPEEIMLEPATEYIEQFVSEIKKRQQDVARIFNKKQ